MPGIKIGVQLSPQHTTYPDYARAVCQVEDLGVDSIWNWDHFFPPRDDPPRGNHFEAWTLLTAMATLTRRARIGCLVTCNSYRNPALLSNMAKTVDHISAGRLILGLGAGWFEPEYLEYGYPFGSPAERLQALKNALPVIQQRWAQDLPLPLQPKIPILIGGNGEKVTLRLTAQYADLWNTLAKPDEFRRKSAVLDEWCQRVGRDPSVVERTVNIYGQPTTALCDDYVAAGATYIILNVGSPWDLTPVEQLLDWRASRQ